MLARASRGIPVLLVGVGLVCCGGTTSTAPPDASTDGSTDTSPAACATNLSGAPAGRPTPAQCAPSTVTPPPDGGAIACTTDADCANDGLYRSCRAGACSPDQCSTDADCAKGQACACANEQTGNGEHTNTCVATQCRSDSDCAAGQVCSPTAQDLCSGGGPFFACHSSADTCRVDADCCSSAPSCRYQSTVGHWACVGICRIAG